MIESAGGAIARHALTLRLATAGGAEASLRRSLASLCADLACRPGLTGAHLLRHEQPAIGQTTEERIRGGDRTADWVFVASGYEVEALGDLLHAELSAPSLEKAGAAAAAIVGRFTLSHSATPSDVIAR